MFAWRSSAGRCYSAYLTATIPDEESIRRTAPAAGIEARPSTLVLDREPIEDGGFSVAGQFTAPIHEPRSLGELREAVRVRGGLGLAVLQAEFDRVRLSFRPSRDEVVSVGNLLDQIGLLNLYQGRYSEAGACFQKALEVGRPKDAPEPDRARRKALLGIIAMRQAQADNDLKNPGPLSGIFPTSPEAVYSDPSGSREAIKRFTAYLEEWPDDLGVRWLLNLAYMTLGEYPEKVPDRYVIPLDSFRSKLDVGRFENVTSKVGLGTRGPNLAGGCAFDDFDGDGRPDLFTTSLGIDRGASLFINRGDGTFADRSADAGPRGPGLRPEPGPSRLRQRRRPRRRDPQGRRRDADAAIPAQESRRRPVRGRDHRQWPGRADRQRFGRLGRLRQ